MDVAAVVVCFTDSEADTNWLKITVVVKGVLDVTGDVRVLPSESFVAETTHSNQTDVFAAREASGVIGWVTPGGGQLRVSPLCFLVASYAVSPLYIFLLKNWRPFLLITVIFLFGGTLIH